MDKSLRLRLVVRRNGLPDSRIMFNVPLAHDPTIANLVELVNETIPLETEEWGLEDYAVELHDKDGHAFECLHFQSITSLLDKDDEVFIRPILTNDLKRRRLSGRIQIAHSGQHLVDGVPYGRPRLRAPRGRPAVHIAPRKRRRLTYDGDFDQDDFEEDYLDDDEQGTVELYTGARETQHDQEDEQRLLTQNGELAPRNSSRRVRFPRSVTDGAPGRDSNVDWDVNADPEDGEDEDEDEGEGEDEDSESEGEEYGQDDIQEELRGLFEEAAANGPARRDDQEGARFRTPSEDVFEPAKGRNNKFGPSSDAGNRQEHPLQYGPQSKGTGGKLDLKLLDKITAIRSAFPAVSTVKCEELLIKHNRDVSSVWKKLAKQVKPRLDLAHTMVLNTQLELPNEIQVMSSPPRKPVEVPGEVSRIEDDEDDEDDEHGIPSGSSSDKEREEHAEEQESTSGGEQDDENDIESDSTSSSSEGESDESEGESQSSSSGQAGKQQREKEQDDDSDSSSDDSSGSGIPQYSRSSRRRRNVIESSPQRSQLDTVKAGTARGASRVPGKVASPVAETDIYSGEEGGEAKGGKAKGGSGSSSSSSDTDTDTDSSTDSSSSSGSESDAQPSASNKTNKTPIKPGAACTPAACTPAASSARPPPYASHASAQVPVPPGQGMTKTQRRNVRRRLQKQRQAALSDETAPEDTRGTRTSDADLIAKKAALLRSLGTSDLPDRHSEEAAEKNNAPSPAKDGRTSHMHTDEDPEAWKQKISYRAVECVTEGVELSEPPFPFVQRWDPQQRQRRGKRKSRNDTQFYGETGQHGTKKRKLEPSRLPVDDYQENVTLNYDDVPFNAEERPITNDPDARRAERDQLTEDDEDDLPSLPEDLTSIPSLHPEDLAPGMVIAWKQLIVSKATNWQPTLSGFLTAVVLEVEEDGKNFKVQLARRDRDVDKTEKEYDENGQRIYGKLEAPDDDDDEAEKDMGFRDMSIAEMMDPRIVQQPALPVIVERTPRLPGLDIEVADSQPEHKEDGERRDSSDSKGNTSSSHGIQLTTLVDENDEQGQHDLASTVHLHVFQGSDAIGESFVSDTNRGMDIGDADKNEDGVDVPAQRINPGGQVSISKERREEISQVINNGGFRQEVRASIDQSALLRLGSPSRQLEEEASSMLFPRQLGSPQRFSSEEAPSEYGSKGPSQQDSLPPAPEPARDILHSAPQFPSRALIYEGTSGPANSAGGVEYPSLSFTSQTSARSGRQFDPNFVVHSDDLGIEPSEDSALMGGFGDDSNSMDDSNDSDVDSDDDGSDDDVSDDDGPGDRTQTPTQQIYNDFGDDSNSMDDSNDSDVGSDDDGSDDDGPGDRTQTPTQQIYNDDLHYATNRQVATTPLKSTQLDPKDNGTPGSGGSNSTRSSSIFLDLELLGSQPAKIKFPEQIKEEPMAFQAKVKHELLSQQVQRMSQLPRTDEAESLPAPSSECWERGRKSVVNGTPRNSQRTRRASLLADLPSSPLATNTTTKSPERSKANSGNGVPVPNGNPKPLIASFDASISPPTRSRPPQHKHTASPATRSQGKGKSFRAASPIKVVGSFERDDLLTEAEPAYTEMYADDDVDEDYTDSVPSMKKITRRLPSSRAGRGASLPLAETDVANERSWVPSTYQGAIGKTPDGKEGHLSTASP